MIFKNSDKVINFRKNNIPCYQQPINLLSDIYNFRQYIFKLSKEAKLYFFFKVCYTNT